MAIIGPTSSGKTSLANALFRQQILASDALPNTLLPVIVSMGAVNDYVVELLGNGLQSFAANHHLLPAAHGSLSMEAAFNFMAEVNDCVRKMLRSCVGTDPPYPIESIYTWQIKLTVPVQGEEAIASFDIIDCPGGSEAVSTAQENGLLGLAIKVLPPPGPQLPPPVLVILSSKCVRSAH